MTHLYKERDEQRKEDALSILREHLQIEEKLISHYQKTAGEIENLPLQYMLNMIQRDEMKHKEICQLVIEILQGEDLLKAEKEDLRELLAPHHDLEEGSIDRLNKILENPWIIQIPGFRELFKKMRKDDKRHHDAIENVLQKPFFRLDPMDIVTVFRDPDFLEKRYERTRNHERRQNK